MYSNLINLREFFANLNGKENYCVLKMPDEFPNYYEHSDLDILCKDRTRMLDYTTRFLKKYDNIDVRIRYPGNGSHIHVDVYPKGKSLDFKFDFIDSFSVYGKRAMNTGFEDFVLNNKEIKKGAFVPNITCEMVVRMLEYIEHKDTRPDKTKHLEYVQAHHEHEAEFNKVWNAFVNKNNDNTTPKPYPFVLVKIYGGLGNQMFQYAAALALGQHWQCRVKADIRWYDRPDSRTYLLDKYKLAPVFANVKDIAPFESRLASLRHRLRRFVPRYQPTHTTYRQPGFRYDPNLVKLRPPIFLQRGYFQSEKFFADYAATIRDAFQLKDPLPQQGEALRRRIKSSPWPVAVHVRRGDYINFPDTHPLCTRAYYQKAVGVIDGESGQKAAYFVFSDDMDAARSLLSFIPDATFVAAHNDEPWVDMHLIATCRDAIIANSSFSWWGAWLNPHPEKHIIAPHPWFQKETGLDSRDLIPPNWTVLNL